MPLPPSRRDSAGPPPRNVSDLSALVRHHQSYLRGIDPGFLDGKYATPQPVPAGVSDLVGGGEGGDAGGDDIGFWNTDRATATGSGPITLQLTYEPIDGSLHIYWNGISQPPTEWTLDGSTVVISDDGAFIDAGDVFAAAYAYLVGDEIEGSTYDEAVLAQPTLLGYWRLAEDGGTVMLDSSGHGRHGTYNADVVLGASALLTDDPDTAAQFPNLEHGRGVVPYGGWMNVATLTVECWMATDPAFTGIGYMVNRDTNARSWLLRTESGGDNLRYENIGGTAAIGTSTFTDHDRHYVVATYDGTNARLYVDGALIQTTASAGPPAVAADLAVGGTYAGDSTWWVPFYFIGRLGKVALYSGAQSAADILNRWQIGTGTA